MGSALILSQLAVPDHIRRLLPLPSPQQRPQVFPTPALTAISGSNWGFGLKFLGNNLLGSARLASQASQGSGQLMKCLLCSNHLCPAQMGSCWLGGVDPLEDGELEGGAGHGRLL